MSGGRDRVVPPDELSVDDRSALGWAVMTEHPLAAGLVDRARRDGPGVGARELVVIRDAWKRAGRPLPQRHVHRTTVALADGTEIVGVTFVADDPCTRDREPSFGLYLDERWDPPWPHAHLDWPDFGLPADIDALRSALEEVIDRARGGEIVEIGCLGGHGRTGTAIACLAVLTGVPAGEAVAWTRAAYCDQAVETDEQIRFVADFQPSARGPT